MELKLLQKKQKERKKKKEISAGQPLPASEPNASGVLYSHALNAAPVCLMKCSHKIANTRQFEY